MFRYCVGIVGVGVLLAVAAPVSWASPPRAGEKAPGSEVDVQVLATRIDALLEARWQETHAKAAPLADDAIFLRRASLDIAGRIPPASEVRRFLRDTDPDKRRQAVKHLLDGPGYVNHFSGMWRSLLMPEADNNFQIRYSSMSFENWLRKKFSDSAGYDEMVRELLTTPLSNDPRGNAFNVYGDNADTSPRLFFYAKEGKPENLAASMSRVFLGVRLECAQCHDHPFARWTREQFWSQAAFFAGLQAKGQDGFIYQMRELADRRELSIPGTERVAQAAFLDGSEPQWKYKVGARTTLADWITSPDNPYFARAAVNRLWAHFFGTGLVEPIDDFKPDNPASHPELLDELAHQFAAHHFDFKFVIRAITASHAYQLSSVTTDPTQEDPRLFARMAIKGLTPDQVFESFCQATGYRDPTPRGQQFFVVNSGRSDFTGKFERPSRPTEAQTSIPQALALMNSDLVNQVTSLDQGATLGAVADAPFMDTRGRIEALFLVTLSRMPTTEESSRLVQYVDHGGPKHDSRRALADVFWALLNSSEFIINH